MAGASVVRREGKGGQGGYIVVGEVDGEGPLVREREGEVLFWSWWVVRVNEVGFGTLC